MVDFALNHMSVARASYAELLDMASDLGCCGVEVRTDLATPVFDGRRPVEGGAMARDAGLRLLTIAEVPRFNDWSEERRAEAAGLMDIAAAAGAEAISLIPRNDRGGLGNGERQAALRLALRELRPMLADRGLIGLVEPLGFASSALRSKDEAIEAIGELDAVDTFRLVHDTFHHHLAGSGPTFAHATGIVHISGVVDPALAVDEMEDGHRVLVDGRDRLGNAEQIAALLAGGYTGPISFEAFAPEVHDLEDPAEALRASMEFLRDRVMAYAA